MSRYLSAGAVGTVVLFVARAGATPLRVLIDDSHPGDTAPAAVASVLNNDVPGAAVIGNSETYISSLTPPQLRFSYDVIYLDGQSTNSDYQLVWNTKVVPFLRLGGGVIVDNVVHGSGNNEANDLAAGATYDALFSLPTNAIPSGPVSVAAVAGLTDGVTTELMPATQTYVATGVAGNPTVTSGFSWTAVDPGLQTFWSQGGATLGLFGRYGAGRVVFNDDLEYTAVRGGTGEAGNAYRLLANEFAFVSAVPEPTGLVAAAVVGVGGALRRRRRQA